ncbi:hypothetical protein EDC04DRAFT_2619657 [Pisolithus marmoratus]|nr:hypothetical protein EDC04DRAFT_2619657 [Pisolithus marmoratus]
MSDFSPPSSQRRLVGQPLLYAISIFASLGVFLALCQAHLHSSSVMSGIITGPYFKQFFNSPGPIEVGTMVAVLELGALGNTHHLIATSIAAGRVGDIIGRKGTLFMGAFIFTIGGAIQTFTTGFYVMIVGRVVSGFGVGLLSTIVPIYQSEISPPNHRGALACMEFTGNIVGYASSVWTDYFCSFIDSDLSWRIPLFIQCVIGSILATGSLVMPESPRWLIDTDQDEAGMRVIVDLHGGDPNDILAKAEFQEIKDKVMEERGESRSYATMWRRYKRRVLLAMSSQAFAQLAGWLGRDAVLMTGINAIIYVLSTIPTWYLVDRWGRRFILLSGAVTMGIALAFTGWWMYIDIPETPQAVVFCVIVFNAAFGYRYVPSAFYIRGDSTQAKLGTYPVAVAFNFIVGETTPYLQEVITWRLYPMHGEVYPETKGVPLEEMDAVFGEEERLDYESERASLVSSHSSRVSVHSRRSTKSASRGRLSRLLYGNDRSTYQPIEGHEE